MRTNRLSRIFVVALLIISLGTPAAFAFDGREVGDDRATFSIVQLVAQLWERIEAQFGGDVEVERVATRPAPSTSASIEFENHPGSIEGVNQGHTRFAVGSDPTGFRAQAD